MKKIVTLFLFIIISSSAYSMIRNVPGNYSTIQSAINASANGDTVLVEPGTYFENINFHGKKIVVTSRYYISQDLNFINTTIINGSTPSVPDSASCVIISSGEDSTTVLQGFTITGGTGTKWNDIHGAGVYREGGGILIELSAPVIQNNIIKNNFAINTVGVTSGGGGGIRIGDSKPKILNNIIVNNTGLYGAGIVLNYTGCLIKNNIIAYNYGSTSYQAGSGIWSVSNLAGAQKVIENNTIMHNTSIGGTPGVLSWSTNLILRNNIIWGNTSTSPASQILPFGSGTVNVTYCDVEGGYTGTGNINTTPQFDANNFLLANGSACIDAGDSNSVYNDPPDPGYPNLAKYPARGGLRNDIGAYGGNGSLLLSNNAIIGIEENNPEKPEGFKLYQNYPNPFNPSTIIRFDIPANNPLFNRGGQGDFVILKIYDILGKEIQTLLNKKLLPGTYEITWNADKFPGGIYFYELSEGNINETKKMILIK